MATEMMLNTINVPILISSAKISNGEKAATTENTTPTHHFALNTLGTKETHLNLRTTGKPCCKPYSYFYSLCGP